jgi:CheY-like chemotaxis protein
LAALPGFSSLQNIVLPANALAEGKALCLAAGMNYFTTKAIDPATLYELSLKCFSGKAQRSDKSIPSRQQASTGAAPTLNNCSIFDQHDSMPSG